MDEPMVNVEQAQVDLRDLIRDALGLAIGERMDTCYKLVAEAGEPEENLRRFYLINAQNRTQRLYGVQGERYHASFAVEIGFEEQGPFVVFGIEDPVLHEGVLTITPPEIVTTSESTSTDVVE